MDRRSFVVSLFGGLAAAGLGGLGLAQAAAPATAAPVPSPEELAPALRARLDKGEADFSQVVVRRTTVVRRPARYYRRPVVVRRTVVVRRPRRVVVRRRVIYR